MQNEYDLVPGKKINTEFLYMRLEKYLYRPVNKVKGARRFTCYSDNCSAGITLNGETLQDTSYRAS